ncbi:MAG: right-handed parallel beta-helix repeat-containing protein [Gammaproteobacteria bacterium]|nr:right-handed parallel beta-helix repeat-containing protein [Gammaproteobacteria bacterium]MCZ6659302.1 right-handed parallel beta-helix repeat-containing protein [Gammaproteobacteria bacterium]
MTRTRKPPRPNDHRKTLGVPTWIPVTKALVLALAVPRPLHAATYIVDDNYDGFSPATACEQTGGASYFADPLAAVAAAGGTPPGSGHNIRICPGAYALGDNTLNLDQANHTNLVFEGTSGVAADVVISAGDDNDVVDAGVAGLTIQHLSTSDGGRGVDSTNSATGLTLNNLVISNADKSGVEINGDTSTLTNISIVNANKEGIKIKASNATVNGANISSGKDGLKLENGSGLAISNIVVTAAKACVSTKGIDGQISNLTLSGCNNEGLKIDGKNATGSLIVDTATITNAGKDGVSLKNLTTTVSLSNLQIVNAGRDGVRLKDASSVQLLSSTITGSASEGIALRDSVSGSTFAGNTISFSGSRGLLIRDDGLSNNNLIFGNCFQNVLNVQDDEITPSNTYNIVTGGNYYASDPPGTGFSETCIDADMDNICDTAYTIPGLGGWVDNLPLKTCTPTTTDVRLNFTKTMQALTDPVGGIPKSIPGADIRYTVTIAHVGTLGDADALSITDDLDGNITTLSYLQWTAGSIEITAPDVGGGAPTTLTDAIDADEGEFTDTPGARTLTVDCGSLSPGETCTVTYNLVIQ